MADYAGEQLLKLLELRKTILNFGPPFTGKTYSLWTLVRWLKQNNFGPLHLHDLDYKCDSLVSKCHREGLLDYLKVFRYSVVDKVQSGAQNLAASKDLFVAFQSQFNKYWDQVDPRTGGWKDSYKTEAPGAIFYDSLTRYQEIVLEYIVACLGRDIGSPGTDARSDYGKQMNKVMETVQSLKSLPCITGWLAHDQLERDEVSGKVVVLPNVTGRKLPSMLAKEFNIVIYSMTESGKSGEKAKYKWQVAPQDWVRSAGVLTRDDLPTFVEQDYAKIF